MLQLSELNYACNNLGSEFIYQTRLPHKRQKFCLYCLFAPSCLSYVDETNTLTDTLQRPDILISPLVCVQIIQQFPFNKVYPEDQLFILL